MCAMVCGKYHKGLRSKVSLMHNHFALSKNVLKHMLERPTGAYQIEGDGS